MSGVLPVHNLIHLDYRAPVLTVQEAWDVAAYIISKPHPPATAETISTLQ